MASIMLRVNHLALDAHKVEETYEQVKSELSGNRKFVELHREGGYRHLYNREHIIYVLPDSQPAVEENDEQPT